MPYYQATANGKPGVFFLTDEALTQGFAEGLPPDAVEISQSQADALRNPPLTAGQIAALKTAVVQRFMDDKAKASGYDNIFTACTYADEPAVSQFQAEGQAFRAWRSEVWATAYQIMGEVLAGTRGVPTDDDLLAALPALALPG